MRLVRWLLLPVLFLALPAAAEEPLRLAPGEQKVIEVPGVRRIAIAAPDIADVKTLGKSQLLITGQRRGRTTLTLWTASKQIQRVLEVDTPRAEDLARDLKAFGFDGVEVRTIGEKLVVNGHVDSLGDMRKLRKLVEGRSDVTLLVGLDPASSTPPSPPPPSRSTTPSSATASSPPRPSSWASGSSSMAPSPTTPSATRPSASPTPSTTSCARPSVHIDTHRSQPWASGQGFCLTRALTHPYCPAPLSARG